MVAESGRNALPPLPSPSGFTDGCGSVLARFLVPAELPLHLADHPSTARILVDYTTRWLFAIDRFVLTKSCLCSSSLPPIPSATSTLPRQVDPTTLTVGFGNLSPRVRS